MFFLFKTDWEGCQFYINVIFLPRIFFPTPSRPTAADSFMKTEHRRFGAYT